jgi:hypothetical protein
VYGINYFVKSTLGQSKRATVRRIKNNPTKTLDYKLKLLKD